MMFLDCPAYLDEDGARRCGLPAELRCRTTVRSSDGPVEAATIRCPAGHWFNGPIAFLTWDGKDNHDPATAGAGSRAGRDSLQRSHDGRHGGGRSRSGDVPAEAERDVCRPNTAPAYYLGHPAGLWITAMRPRRRRTASNHPVQAVASAGERTPSRHGGPSPAPGPKQPA